MTRRGVGLLVAVLGAVVSLAGSPAGASTGDPAALLSPRPVARPARDVSPEGPVGLMRVVVDPRIELMSIVYRLAGSPEYSFAGIPSYAADVDAHFGRFKDHPVVVRARQLRKTRGISYNAPMSLAVHLTPPPELAERVPLDPLPDGIDPRWTPSDARAFLTDLRAFVRDADVSGFISAHDALYRTATERLQAMVREAGIEGWFDRFHTRPADRSLVLVAALLNGGGNYGAWAHSTGARPAAAGRSAGPSVDETFAILGVAQVDPDGGPSFPSSLSATIVHEFSHSVVNPIVAAHDAELKPAAEKIYSLVEREMRSQAYGSASALVCESLVRASTVRYLSSQAGEEAAKRASARERDQGFLWVGRLADLLGGYERDRGKYPTLDRFIPLVVRFFEEYSQVAAKEVAAVAAERQATLAALAAKGPKVTATSPANGAEDVDAASVTTITFTFDRPMREGNYALVDVRGARLPAVKGPPAFDSTRQVLTLRCQLEPGTTYGVQLNSPQFMAFTDDQGNPLAPYVYRFTTRK